VNIQGPSLWSEVAGKERRWSGEMTFKENGVYWAGGVTRILWSVPKCDQLKPMCRAHFWLRWPQYKREIMLFFKNIVVSF
jgi:hypothetical protein